MNTLQTILIIFVIVELMNVLELYYFRERCMFNNVALFECWERAKEDPQMYALISYLMNWVAGVKLISIGLLLVIVFTTPQFSILIAAISMVLTISTFYWRMYPTLRKQDFRGNLDPKGRSLQLGVMVGVLELGIIAGIITELVKLS